MPTDRDPYFDSKLAFDPARQCRRVLGAGDRPGRTGVRCMAPVAALAAHPEVMAAFLVGGEPAVWAMICAHGDHLATQ